KEMIGKLQTHIKGLDISVPIPIGQLLAHIPYSKRPGVGKIYRSQREAIAQFPSLSSEEKTAFVFTRFKKVFDFAYHTIPFYNHLYNTERITPKDLRSFDDIK